MDDQLREAAIQGMSFFDPSRRRVITAVRLGAEPIASLALQGVAMPDSVLQGIANLVAIGLERARAQDLAHQVEAARQSEQLRTTLIDAMAHELKTPLTSIKAATTSLLATPEQPLASRTELVKIADEEAERLKTLIDNAVEMARLDTTNIAVRLELANLGEVVQEVVASMQAAIEDRPVEVACDAYLPLAALDRRLIKLAAKQLLDNALKYSPPGTAVKISVRRIEAAVALEVSNGGAEIPRQEQSRIFERFYRSPAVQSRIPGSGLGLSIAQRIAQAHNGDLTVASRPGQTTFRLILPPAREENGIERGPNSNR
jgi:two-component system, OmpR family, sensor histidine kinase KdpD